MTSLWHLLVTDLKRQRWLLALWLTIVCGSSAAAGLMPLAATDARTAAQAGLLHLLLSCAWFALFVLLVPIVVQADAAVGSEAFWMTRPISPRTLCAEKLTLLFVALVVVPVGAECVLMAAYGVPLRDGAGVAAQGALVKLLWVLAAMALAVLTVSLPRFTLLAGSLIATLVALMAISVAMSVSTVNEARPLAQAGPSWSPTAYWLLLGAIFIGGILLPLVQYTTRRRIWAIAAGMLCATLGFGAASTLPPSAQPAIGDAPAWARSSSRVVPSASAQDARTIAQGPSRGGRLWILVSAPVHITGLDPGWSAEISIRRSTWKAGNTAWASVAGIGSQPTLIEGDESSVDAATRRALGVSRVIEVRSPSDKAPSAVLAVLDDREHRSLAKQDGRFTAETTVALVHHAVEGAVALHEGAESRHGSHRILITRMSRDSDGASVWLRSSSANSMFGPEQASDRSYYFVNRVLSEAIPASLEPADASGLSFIFPTMGFSAGYGSYEGTGFNVATWLLRLASLSGPTGPIWRFSDDWVNNAELVVLARRREGFVDRDFRIDNFPLSTAPLAENR